MTIWSRKAHTNRGVASGVAGKRHIERDPPRVAAGFGQRALELTEAAGKTKQDLMEAAGVSLSTINRLARGEGAFLAASKVKQALRRWGIDVSTLPAVDSDDTVDGVVGMDETLREGMELVKRLYQLATDERFRQELDRLHDLVRAHELVAGIAEGTDKLKIRRP